MLADDGSVDTARCPACSAVVRTDADWCSLCYQDLRPPPMISVPSPAPISKVVTSQLTAAVGKTEVSEGNADPTAPSAAEATDAVGWPCACGNQVGFDQDDCPACGSPFLGDLRGDNDGRHRVRSGFGAHWNESRVFRFVVAGGVSLLIAVGIPLMLALIG